MKQSSNNIKHKSGEYQFTAPNVQKYLAYLKRKWDSSEIPQEIQDVAKKNLHKLRNLVLNINVQPRERPMSPMIKNMAPGAIIPLRSPFSTPERKYIGLCFKALKAWLGEPQFDYSEVEEKDFYKVDAWNSIVKISPKLTEDANLRRFDNLEEAVHEKRVWKPHTTALKNAISETLKDFPVKGLKPNFDSTNLKGNFAAHSSNVGYPFFSNEKAKAPDGNDYRTYTVAKAREWMKKFGPWSFAKLPAVIIGRDQAGGWEIDLKDTDFSSFDRKLSSLRYKPNKARVVWAEPRILTLYQVEILKALIDSPFGKSNPTMAGFFSQDQRLPLYSSYYDTLRRTDTVSDNRDYITFDQTLASELLSLSGLILKSFFDLSQEQEDIFDVAMAQLLFTSYVAYDPYHGVLVDGVAIGGLPSGTGWTGILGLIANKIANYYAKIRQYGYTKVRTISQKFRDAKTFSHTGLGDDSLSWQISYDDVHPQAEILVKEMNLKIATEGIKAVRGVFFLQERYMPESKLIYYPALRVMGNCLYTERNKSYGPATWDIAFMGKVYNLRYLPEEILLSLTGILMSCSKTKLGLLDINGNKQTIRQLLDRATAENAEHGVSVKDAIWDGDISKERLYKDGKPDPVIMKWWFNLLDKAENFKSSKYPCYANIKW